MKTVIENNVLPPESYVVEIDGKIRSVYGIFIEALKAGMELKQKFPQSHIKVHDVDETCASVSSLRSSVNSSRIPGVAAEADQADNSAGHRANLLLHGAKWIAVEHPQNDHQMS